MPVVERSALLMFSADQMFRLVDDVESYPQFLPGCTGATIEHRDATRVRARVDFSVHGLSDRFATENVRVAGERIDMRLVHGPFSSLTGSWHFTALSERASKVSLKLSLEFGSPLLARTLAPWIDRAVNGVMDAFRRRAEQLYGRG